MYFFHVKKSKLWLIFNKPSIYESDDKQLEISKLLHFNSLSYHMIAEDLQRH